MKVGIHNPVLLPKTGIFILRTMKMGMGQKLGSLDLKLFLTISFVFHALLLLILVSLLLSSLSLLLPRLPRKMRDGGHENLGRERGRWHQ